MPDPDGVGFGLDFFGIVPVYPVDCRVTGVDLAGGGAVATAEAAALSSLSFLKMTFLL